MVREAHVAVGLRRRTTLVVRQEVQLHGPRSADVRVDRDAQRRSLAQREGEPLLAVGDEAARDLDELLVADEGGVLDLDQGLPGSDVREEELPVRARGRANAVHRHVRSLDRLALLVLHAPGDGTGRGEGDVQELLHALAQPHLAARPEGPRAADLHDREAREEVGRAEATGHVGLEHAPGVRPRDEPDLGADSLVVPPQDPARQTGVDPGPDRLQALLLREIVRLPQVELDPQRPQDRRGQELALVVTDRDRRGQQGLRGALGLQRDPLRPHRLRELGGPSSSGLREPEEGGEQPQSHGQGQEERATGAVGHRSAARIAALFPAVTGRLWDATSARGLPRETRVSGQTGRGRPQEPRTSSRTGRQSSSRASQSVRSSTRYHSSRFFPSRSTLP